MFGVSFTELIVVFAVALMLFGPEQLPGIARQIGRLMAEFKKGSDSIRKEFYNSVYTPAEEVKRDFTKEARELRTLKTEILSPPSTPEPLQAIDSSPSKTEETK